MAADRRRFFGRELLNVLVLAGGTVPAGTVGDRVARAEPFWRHFLAVERLDVSVLADGGAPVDDKVAMETVLSSASAELAGNEVPAGVIWKHSVAAGASGEEHGILAREVFATTFFALRAGPLV